MSKPIVFMYSGQGSQFYQMGLELYEKDPVFRDSISRISQIAEPIVGCSLEAEVYTARAKRFEAFDRTRYTHPAIVMVQLAATQALAARGVSPDYVLGYSLGELSAAIAAEALSLEDGIQFAARQGVLLEEKAPEGTMLAVIGSSDLYSRHAHRFEGVHMACVNFDGHFVLTGPRDQLTAVSQILEGNDQIVQALPIRLPFHSMHIDGVASAFAELAAGLAFRPPAVPFVSCRARGELGAVNASVLWRSIRETVFFNQTIRNFDAEGPFAYVDMGPAGTLSGFLRQLLGPRAESDFHLTLTPFKKDLANLDKIAAAL